MRLKNIALLVVAIVLVVGSSAGAIAIARVGAEDEGGKSDAYWWEDRLEEDDRLTPYEQRLVKEIIVLIFDRYFGVDVSRMTSEEMDEEVARLLIYPEGIEKYIRLFEEYAQRKGFEIPEYQGCIKVDYWWEIVCDAERTLKALFRYIALAKEMTPGEVEERFEELFPGVDLWNMTYYEFHHFLISLPRPPCFKLKLICFEELRLAPYIIALFGRVPAFATEEELKEFTVKLEQLLDKAWPSLIEKLLPCEFPPMIIAVYPATIWIVVNSDQLPRAEEVYQFPRAEEIYRIIAEKAENLFGIEDVPVVFSGGGFFPREHLMRADSCRMQEPGGPD